MSGISCYFSLKKDSNVFQFYQKRLQKTIPTYLAVAVPFWVIMDLVVRGKSIGDFFGDLLLISFFTSGNRSFWYVMFMLISYAVFPVVFYLIDDVKFRNQALPILAISGVLIAYVPRLAFPGWYAKCEILLCRFLVFFLGAYCGKKVYHNSEMSIYDKVFLAIGVVAFVAMRSGFTVLNRIGPRFVMTFYGISLTAILGMVVAAYIPKAVNCWIALAGNVSYELYLTHVSIRGIMNAIGFATYKISNYLMCIALSIAATCALNWFANYRRTVKKRNKQ